MPETSVYGLSLTPNSISPTLLPRRSVPAPSTVGLSPPSPILAQNTEDQTARDVMAFTLNKGSDCAGLMTKSSPSVSIGNNTAFLDAVATDLRTTCRPTPTSTSRGGSPHQESECQSESFGHKKFDKFRKEKALATGDEAWAAEKEMQEKLKTEVKIKKDLDSVEDDKGQQQQSYFSKSTSPVSPSGMNNYDGAGPDNKSKRSAKEAHPNLLAHLNSPAQVISKQPVQSAALATSTNSAFSTFSWNQPSSHQSNTTFSKAAVPQSCGVAPALGSSNHQQVAGTEGKNELKLMSNMGEMGSREQFHAVAVSHLKDKLLRKFDSMENLHKMIGASKPSTSTSTSTATISVGELLGTVLMCFVLVLVIELTVVMFLVKKEVE